MILQVHDELIFEVPEKDLEEAKHLVKTGDGSDGKEAGIVGALKSRSGDRAQLASGASVADGVARTIPLLAERT